MSYTVNGQSVTEFAEARVIADELSSKNNAEVAVIHTETGALAYQTSAHPAAHGVGIFDPWTRIQVVPAAWTPPAVEGYVFAYKRERIQTAVYRPLEKGQPWLVWNTATGEKAYPANTKAACAVTKRMGQEAKGA